MDKRLIFFSLLLLSLCSISKSWAATELLLVRHGQTDWNKENRIQGHVDIPLNDIGIAQARAFADSIVHIFPEIGAIYSSDLDRAYTTALATAEKYNLPVFKNAGLREADFGSIDGMSIEDSIIKGYIQKQKELFKICPEREKRWDIPFAPGVETNNHLLNRIKNELFVIAQEHPDQTVIVFFHGKAIATLLSDILDEEIQTVHHCAAAHISVDRENKNQPMTFHKVIDVIDNH